MGKDQTVSPPESCRYLPGATQSGTADGARRKVGFPRILRRHQQGARNGIFSPTPLLPASQSSRCAIRVWNFGSSCKPLFVPGFVALKRRDELCARPFFLFILRLSKASASASEYRIAPGAELGPTSR